MQFETYMWLVSYLLLLFANFSLYQAMKFQRRRHELELAVMSEAIRVAYATGWLHAYQDLGISGSRRLSKESDSELKIESFSDRI